MTKVARHIFAYLAVFYICCCLGAFIYFQLHRSVGLYLTALYAVMAVFAIAVEVSKNGWDWKAKKSRSLKSHPQSHSRSQPLIERIAQRYLSLADPPSPSPSGSPSQRKLNSPVVGFRVWAIHEPSGYGEIAGLHSIIGGNGQWYAGVNQAKCRKGMGHRCAAPGCQCGFWIKNSLSGALTRKVPGYVLGIALGWGQVVVQEDGWRAEFASVVALSGEGWWPPTLVASHYVGGINEAVVEKHYVDAMNQKIAQVSRALDVPMVKYEKGFRSLQDWYLANTE